ncbi:MAG TPA: aminotransferase class V-fold PLP-dependent enzyme [Longimicrobiales bacterium]|nr:aminotransferase class V-fold PLP-dependent enzyme [Longimicrobiales bacterium]
MIRPHAPLDLPALRRHYPILAARNYLNSCSLGALSDRATAYLEDFQARWHTMGASAWYEHWWGRLALLRERVEHIHGAAPGTMALLPSTSAALSVVIDAVPELARGTDLGTGAASPVAIAPGGRSTGLRRNRVVMSELDFPTLAYQWATRPELEVVVLESPDGVGMDPQQYADAVDERTLFLATSHVFFATGFVQDLGELAAIAGRAGAWSLIDGYHGPGQVPVDVGAAGVDIYTSGPLKWLCGGPGLSYLYVRGDRIPELTPRATSWFAHRDPFAFDLRDFEYQDDARRFELGTPALATVHTALGGQELLEEVGLDRVHQRCADLRERLVEGCRRHGLRLRIAEDPARRSSIVMVEHHDPKGAVRSLDEAGIIVDSRPGHVRVSPHVYNTEDEVDQAVTALAGLSPKN